MKRWYVLSSLFAWFATSPAFAQGIPVIDVQSVFQEALSAARALQQIEQQRKAFETQLEELGISTDQLEALTGVTGLGDVLNTPVERSLRRYVPGTWQETLAILEAGGNPASLSDVKRIYGELEKLYRISTAEDVGLLGEEDPTVQAQDRNRRSTLASAAIAEAAYEIAPSRVDTYEALMRQIERAPTAKMSSDLANRILAENGLTTNEVVRLLSTQISAESAARSQELVAASKVDQRFSRAPQASLRTLEAQLRNGSEASATRFARAGGDR